MNAEEILDELYQFDPSLRSEDADLKEIIEKLIEKKPDVEPDEEFRARLKSELLERVRQNKKRASFFLVHRKAIVGAAGIAAAVIIVLTFAIRPGFFINIKSTEEPAMTEAAEIALDDMEADSGIEIYAEAKDQSLAIADEAESERTFSGMAARQPVQSKAMSAAPAIPREEYSNDYYSNESYSSVAENSFVTAAEEPVSTFSIDVDTASYSNVRRYINNGSLPPADAVRIEELINYFTYDYPQPKDGKPFSFTSELSTCPWNSNHLLLHLGLQGYEVAPEEVPPSNIVFLLDTSGSMQDENKLPLLKQSMALLLDTLRAPDRVSIVAYAGSAGLILPPTPGNSRQEILAAMDRLEAGGSTAGGAGIELAYRTAAANLIENGNNRVIIATDGDFNVGQSSEDELKTLIEQYRDQGIYLTVLGLGMGNYKDSRMEVLADNGNGNYAYIDTLNEANKVLVTEFSSTMLTIARDVKIQIDFNKQAVGSYRLIGYENRVMAAEDFTNDKKDAGEIGAGHSVTALYEIIPSPNGLGGGPLAEIRFRYKKPNEDQGLAFTETIGRAVTAPGSESENFRFSAAVAEWGLLLGNSSYRGSADINQIIDLAESSPGSDPYGYRSEFMGLLYKTRDLMK